MSCWDGPPKTLHVYIEVFMVNHPVFQKGGQNNPLFGPWVVGGQKWWDGPFFPEAKASEGSIIDAPEAEKLSESV